MAMPTLTRTAETSPADLSTEPPAQRGGLLGWLLVALALTAAIALAALLVTSGDDPEAPRPWYSAERGSISAIDHSADAAAAGLRPTIAAADHAAAVPGTPAEVSAQRGSITAIDHAAQDGESGAG